MRFRKKNYLLFLLLHNGCCLLPNGQKGNRQNQGDDKLQIIYYQKTMINDC